jgi:hypothetical protein
MRIVTHWPAAGDTNILEIAASWAIVARAWCGRFRSGVAVFDVRIEK